MPHIITRKTDSVEQNWLKQLTNAISDPQKLLEYLNIDSAPFEKGLAARALFAQRIPMHFIEQMEKGNPNDPLLRQVLPVEQEFEQHSGFTLDPLGEQETPQPGLLHKYKNRVLLIVKGGCAINCRYCFRRHFPYQDAPGGKTTWQHNLDYIAQHAEINEVILSGGDPLMAKDHELEWLINGIAAIAHVKTVRIHTRLPVVIPDRITQSLCELFAQTRLNVVLITHINHPNEMDSQFDNAMAKLRRVNVTLLNQGVLLKGVNDSASVLVALSERLFSAGILPYYLHLLDKVQGAAHFHVSDSDARDLMQQIIPQLSGYLVPRLTREISGRSSKTPIDLYLE
jgi:EF-P beta-lysylation protein EpmB